MRGLVPHLFSVNKSFLFKTYSDNSIEKCDSKFSIPCQDVLSIYFSGDLGLYALSAKDFVDVCFSMRCIQMSGSSFVETLCPLKSELTRSSSMSGEDDDRIGVDLLLLATPASLLSVIINSVGPSRTLPTNIDTKTLWDKEELNLFLHPSQPIDSGFVGGVLSQFKELFKQHEALDCSELLHLPIVQSSVRVLYKVISEMGRELSALTSINIPFSDASHSEVDEESQSTDSSFKMSEESRDFFISSATRNQYASFHTSKNLTTHKQLGKYGFDLIPSKFFQLNRWGIPRALGLFGGGESTANGWGATASQSTAWGGNNGNNQSNTQAHWGPGRSGGPQASNPQPSNLKPNQNQSSSQPPPNSGASSQSNPPVNPPTQMVPSNSQPQHPPNQPSGQVSGGTSWAQTAGKGLPSGNGSSDAQKLQNIKEALLSCEGWSGENVNQETQWDVSTSPEPGKDGTAPLWKLNMNNGCDLWENNIRNGGAAPPKPQQAPWGQNPATNYGGTWGDDDEYSDTSNLWNSSQGNQPPPAQWGNNPPNPPLWGPPKKNTEFGQNPPGWGELVPPRPGVEVGASEWGIHKPSPHPGPHPGTHPISHPQVASHPGLPHAPVHPPAPHPVNAPTPHGVNHVGPHGPAPHGPLPHGASPYNPSTPCPLPSSAAGAPNQWGTGTKDIKSAGWEEPTASNRKDDGTAVWGNPNQQQSAGISRWKDMPNPNMMTRPGMAAANQQQQNRLPGVAMQSGPNKSDQRMWNQPGRNGAWGDAPHDTGAAMWGEESKPFGWNDPTMNSSWATKPKTPTGAPGGWAEQDIDIGGWNSHNKVNKGVKDYVNNGKHIRALYELGYKKEDIEAALRNNAGGLDESLAELNSRGCIGGNGGEVWRSPMDDQTNTPFTDMNTPNFHQRFPPAPYQQLPLNSQLQANNGNPQQIRYLMQHIQGAVNAGYLNPQILSQPLAPNSLVLLNNMLSQITNLQKLLQQHGLCQAQAHTTKGSTNHILQLNIHITKTRQQITNLQNQIAAQQASYLKQQQQQQPIQHQHHQQHQQGGAQPHQQQGVGAQQHQQPHSQHINASPYMSGGAGNVSGLANNVQNEYFKAAGGMPEHFYNSFNQMNVADNVAMNSGLNQHQGSRLNQWKLPNVESEESFSSNNDFVRAPGKPSLPQSQSSPNLTPLLSSTSTAWALSNRPGESGWPETSSGVMNETTSSAGDKNSLGVGLDSSWASTHAVGSSSYGLDIKPFEPGKQWMVKNIEDDPNITPGSVTRSPLSLGIKDSDLLTSISKTATSSTNSSDMSSSGAAGSGSAAGPLTSLSLSANTWSFNPSGQPANSASDSKSSVANKHSTSAWSDGSPSSTALASELWSTSANKIRGPPPGMSSNNGGSKPPNNSSWGGIGRSPSWTGDPQRVPRSALPSASSATPWTASAQMPSTTWLVLKNLTPQIDGSTLKTLCMQHGPLVNFHLSLNHGFALVNYGSTDEAVKAQGSLNNCLLSNTTILAEFASDNEIKQVLCQGPPPPSTWNNPVTRGASTPTSSQAGSSGGVKGDSWSGAGGGSTLWMGSGGPNSGANSLWGAGGLTEGEQQRATPSTLKSYLPDGILTSESSM